MIDFNLDIDFDLGFEDDSEQDKKIQNEDFLIAKQMEFENRHYRQVKAVRGVLDCELPEVNQEWFFVSRNIFNQFAFILTILELEGDIEELYISSYNLKPELTGTLKKLMKAGRVGACSLILTDSLGFRNPGLVGDLKKLAEKNENFNVKFCRNHSKIGLAKTVKGNYYVVSGSGNFTATNTKIEFYHFTNNQALYDFLKQVFEKAEYIEPSIKEGA